MVQRSVVSGRVDAVKTEYSKDYVPLDPRLEGLLLEWRTFSAFPSDADWVFANPQTGKPFHQESLKKHQLHRVAELIGLPFLAGRDRRSHEGAAGADATRLHPDDDEHLWTGDERLQTQSQQPGRWAGIRRNDGIEKGGIKHNSPSVEGLNQWPFPIGG
jgi:hypothetical protein